MDYKIKLEYKGIGKAATAARQKVLQAQKVAEKKGVSPVADINATKQLAGINQKLINSNKSLEKAVKAAPKVEREKVPVEKIVPPKIERKAVAVGKEVEERGLVPRVGAKAELDVQKQLIDSNKKLIDSNKNLDKTIKTGGAEAPRRRIPGVPGAGAAPGIGKIGASLPVVGAGIAALGFTIQKINQIGNAYIDLASQQLKTVGFGGFRRGEGIYGATEMGAGMGAFARGTGRFAENIEAGAGRIQGALAIGTRYGMSAEDILRQAGVFKRAGGDIRREAGAAVTGGIEADMPILLSGMSIMMEEAIRKGVDTTEMSKNLGRGLTALAMETPGKSAAAALEIAKSIQGVKKSVVEGKYAGYENLKVAEAGQQILMERLQDPKYIKQLTETEFISQKMGRDISKMEEGADFGELQKRIGVAGAKGLLEKTVEETGDLELRMQMMKNVQKEWGTTPEARLQYEAFAKSMGSSLQSAQFLPMWNLTKKDLPKSDYVKGMKKIEEGATRVEAGEAGMAAKRMIQRQNLIIEHGDKFAAASLKMETAMINLADKSMDTATGAVEGLGNSINVLIGGIDDLAKIIDALNKGKGIFDLFD